MFKCSECGQIFDQPEEIRNYHGEGMWETKSACPYCGEGITTDDESKPCDICGGDAFGSCFCDDCKDTAKRMLMIDFNEFPSTKFRDLVDLFTEALDDLYVEERSKK